MLPLAGKALGVILAIVGSAYLLPFACSAVTPDATPMPTTARKCPTSPNSTSQTTWATRPTAR